MAKAGRQSEGEGTTKEGGDNCRQGLNGNCFQLTARLNALHWRWVNINLLRCRDCPNCQTENQKSRKAAEGEGQRECAEEGHCRQTVRQAGSEAGRQINCNYNKQSQWKAIRNENHVLRLCRRLPPCFPTFSTFPLCDFSILEFFFFYSCCSCSGSGSARMARVCLDCLAKHVHCDFVHEIHVVLFRPGAQREPTRRSTACAIDPGN